MSKTELYSNSKTAITKCPYFLVRRSRVEEVFKWPATARPLTFNLYNKRHPTKYTLLPNPDVSPTHTLRGTRAHRALEVFPRKARDEVVLPVHIRPPMTHQQRHQRTHATGLTYVSSSLMSSLRKIVAKPIYSSQYARLPPFIRGAGGGLGGGGGLT